jgi:hypothetical protein
MFISVSALDILQSEHRSRSDHEILMFNFMMYFDWGGHVFVLICVCVFLLSPQWPSRPAPCSMACWWPGSTPPHQCSRLPSLPLRPLASVSHQRTPTLPHQRPFSLLIVVLYEMFLTLLDSIVWHEVNLYDWRKNWCLVYTKVKFEGYFG